jgi:hypothetical protein
MKSLSFLYIALATSTLVGALLNPTIVDAVVGYYIY